MMNTSKHVVAWRTRRDGKHYRVQPKKIRQVSSGNPIPPRKPTNRFARTPSDDSDDRREKELEEYPRQLKEKEEEKEKERSKRKKDELLERLKHDSLCSAKFLLISATPYVVSSDPSMTLATIYATWKFAKFSYDFIVKFEQEYRKTGSLEKTLLNIAFREIGQQLLSKLEEYSVKNVSESIGKILWNYYKQENQSFKISDELDKHIQNAIVRTFEEILNRVV